MITKNGARLITEKLSYLVSDCAYERLWFAVLCQAIRDAATDNNGITARQDAINWLMDDGDVERVCDMCSIDHEYMQSLMRTMAKRAEA